jgi:hypothetical protein
MGHYSDITSCCHVGGYVGAANLIIWGGGYRTHTVIKFEKPPISQLFTNFPEFYEKFF